MRSKRKRISSDEDEDATDDQSGSERPVKRQKHKNKAGTKHWSLEDVAVLLDKVRAVLPKHDTVRYALQLNRLDWEAVSFNSYSADLCKQKFSYIMEKIRHNQTLSELVASGTDMIQARPQLFRDDQSYTDLPKKPLSSYFHFLADKRQKLKSSHPDLNSVELTKLLSAKYNSLSPKKKRKYLKMAQASKEEYENKMTAFRTEHPEFEVKSKGLFSDAPKIPTPLALFTKRKLSSVRESFPEEPDEHCKGRCKEMWAELKNKKKLKWIRKAAAAWPQFVEEMDAYIKKYPSFPVKPQSLFTAEEQRLKDKDDGKPPKPPRNGFYLFMQEGKEHSDGNESLPELRERWKNLPKETQKLYSDQAKQAQEDYNNAYEDYLERVGEVQYTIGKKISHGAQGVKGAKVKMFTKIKTCPDDDDDVQNNNLNNVDMLGRSDSDNDLDDKEEKPGPTSKQTMITNYITGKKIQNEKKVPKTFPGEPPRPVKSAYQLFCKDWLSSLNDVPHKERMQEIARRWKEVTSEEKHKLQERVEKQKHRYKKKLKHFKESLTPEELEYFDVVIARRTGAKGKSKQSKVN
ncbi:nucleolar transcription factor 1-A-like [Gigantopelta aegis]|uniref:nucleolar transcription factor 1-A-like n=1 Tax=Gigantopelta aegis TaxID=1735272 RepID=UPI001B88E344|nr:nucleolar transcription factor 1-A-like [Gigantopelta aegis]